MAHPEECKCERCRPFGGETFAESLVRKALKTQDPYYLERLRDRADSDRKADKGE